MNDIRQAVTTALQGDARSFASFGIERRLSTGIQAQPSGVFQWEQRLMLSGAGIGRLVLYRPVGDQCGVASGVYQTPVEPELLRELAQLTLDSGILDYNPGHIEPGDLMIRFRIAAMGIAHEVMVSADSPPRQQTVRDFLMRLSMLYTRLINHPLRTAALRATVQPGIRAATGRKRLPLTLSVRNEGSQGHWMRNPAAMFPDGGMERRYVTWVPVPRIGELPPTASIGVLEPVDRMPPSGPGEEEKLLWLPPGSAVDIPCSAIVNFPTPGRYYFHAAYITMAGELVHQGQPRWIGGMFSAVQEIVVP